VVYETSCSKSVNRSMLSSFFASSMASQGVPGGSLLVRRSRLMVNVNCFSRRIDSLKMLPKGGRCLTKMLPGR